MPKATHRRSSQHRKGDVSGPPTIFTIGHSTRPQADFIALLQAHGIQRLADVRTLPRSRHNPQFNRDALAAALKRAKIGYTGLKGLGGLRHPRPDSANGAWRNAGFRGYADYMQTREFVHHLRRLIKLAKTKKIAIMCAEGVPWRCHRSLIADALLVRGYDVEEIASRRSTRPHTLTPWARVRGTRITYPPAASSSVPPSAAGRKENSFVAQVGRLNPRRPAIKKKRQT